MMLAIWSDWHTQWTFALSLCALIFSLSWVKPRFGREASMLLLYCFASAIYVWAWKDNRYVTVNPYDQMALRYFAVDSVAKILMLCVPLMLLAENKDTFELLGTVLCGGFVLFSSLIAIAEFAFSRDCGHNNCGGLVGNPSISMGMMACMLPIVLKSWKRQKWLLIIAAAAIFVSQSSIAVGLLAVYATMWLFPWDRMRSGRFTFSHLAYSLGGFVGVMGLGRVALGGELLNDSDRFKIWKFMLERWALPSNAILGTGLGSYHVFSINLQHLPVGVAAGITQGDWWNSLHNDWLEMLFCGGVVGVLLLLSTYCAALFKLWKEKEWHFLMSAVLFGLYMFLDPALRSPLPCLFGAWAFVYALRKPQKEYVV